LLLALQVLPGLAQEAQQPPKQPPPKPMDEARPDTSDGLFSLELYYLETIAQPALRQGTASTDTKTPGNLNLPRKAVANPGAVFSFPAGRENTLRVSYFRLQGRGDMVAARDFALFSEGYSAGDFLATRYTLQNAKVSFDYLSYPYPPEDSKFRFRLLFEGQYTTIQTTINAPRKTDTAGNPAPITGQGSKWFIYPTLGGAVERALSKHFRVEVKATGFAIPHHAAIWDAEASAAYRHGKVEFLLLAKAFHFKTSPKQDEYMKATLPGVGVGLRWYP
jgi:hypothetical protein